jgi:ABC-type sugar transport system ATPase subunit
MGDGLVIETQRLTKRYGPRIVAVDDLDLRVRRGEVYGFLGLNGAGKTTTLRLLLGLVRPTSGNARVLGAAPGSPEGLARIGALIETPAFYPFLSGLDNLRALPATPASRRRRRPGDSDRGRPRGGRALCPSRRSVPHLLAGDEAAPRDNDEAWSELSKQMPAEYVEAFFGFFVDGDLDESQVLQTVEEVTGPKPRTYEQRARAHIEALS